jgi:2-keto-4-pentenoate hydratase
MDKNKLDLIINSFLKKRKNNYFIVNDRPNMIPNDQEEAYFIQNKIHSLLNSDSDKVIGRKIGCTTKVMQNYLKIDHPCAGTLRQKNCYNSNDIIDTKLFNKVGVECEIAIRLAEDIFYSKTHKLEDLYPSIESVFPAIEIVDDRYSNWKNFTVNHLIADDFFSAGCVLGNNKFEGNIQDVGKLEGSMFINNIKVGAGIGNHILGNPFNALKWLSSRKDIIGDFIPKNSIILLGSLVETYWVVKGDEVRIKIEGMDSVHINFH